VVIGTDSTGSSKSTYYTITTMTAPTWTWSYIKLYQMLMQHAIFTYDYNHLDIKW
jgi:hypothetical protein